VKRIVRYQLIGQQTICLILDRIGSNALPIMLDLEIPLIVNIVASSLPFIVSYRFISREFFPLSSLSLSTSTWCLVQGPKIATL
jgi:hypothetical protein